MIRKWWRRKTRKPPVGEIAIQVLTPEKGWLDLIRLNSVDLGLMAKWGGHTKDDPYEEAFAKGAVIRYTIHFVADGNEYDKRSTEKEV